MIGVVRTGIAVALAAAMQFSRAQGLSVQWSTNIQVRGLAPETLRGLKQLNWSQAQWQAAVTVRAEQGNILTDMNLPAMAGDYSVQENALVFTPKFNLEPGVSYRVIVRPDVIPGAKGAIFSASHRVPPRSLTPKTRVAAVYPTASELPQNLLKFYIAFSGPMSSGQIYEHIRLYNSAGQLVELPFLEIDEELWDPGMTRLTLLLDPGRIKRGLRPLEEVGTALLQGQTYTFKINRNWRDADGAELTGDFEKKFKVTAPDREPIEPKKWKVTAPKSKSRAPLKIAFRKPLDHALAERVIRVADPSGFQLTGQVQLESDDRQWTFTPDQPWKAGQHQLVMPTLLEDLAGNKIGKAFDVETQSGPRPATSETYRLPINVK